MTSYRPALKTAGYGIFAFLIGVWTLPGAALGVAMFAPSLFTPFNGFFFGALVMYAAAGLGMPLVLLLTGIKIVAASRGWWWLVAWTATVATGFAFEYATLPFLISMARARGARRPLALAGACLGRRLRAARRGGGTAPCWLAARRSQADSIRSMMTLLRGGELGGSKRNRTLSPGLRRAIRRYIPLLPSRVSRMMSA